jgi:hypothetical protein
MAENRRTGKGAYLLLGGNRVEVTSLKSNVATEWARSTDSSDYDAADDILFGSQQPGETRLEVDVEGNFDLNSTSANVIGLIRKGALVPASIYSTPSTPFASGNFNVENGSVSLTVPGATMYTFTCKLTSNGPFTLGGG